MLRDTTQKSFYYDSYQLLAVSQAKPLHIQRTDHSDTHWVPLTDAKFISTCYVLLNEVVATQQELSCSELGVVTVAGISVLACSVGQVDS